MQKIYTLTLAAITALAASAATVTPTKSFDKMPTNAVKVDGWHNNASKSIKQHSKPLSKAPLKTYEDGEAIFDPEGTAQTYSVKSTRFEVMYGQLMLNYGEYPSKIVFGDDNKVYIRDIITYANSGVYVEGTREGDKITVNLPQTCYYVSEEYEGEVYTEELVASKMEYYTYEKNGMTYMSYRNVAEEDNYVVYNIAEDGTITLDLNQGDPTDTTTASPYIIGLCEDSTPGVDDWFGYGELYQTFTPFNATPNTIPDDVEMETWGMTADGANGIVQVGFGGDNVYISGIIEYLEDAVIIGKIEGDKVIFETPQYLGEFEGCFVWFNACRWTSTEWEEYNILDRVELNYDAENKVISTDDELIDFVFSTSAEEILPLDYVSNPTFMYITEEDLNAAPEDPYVVYFDHYAYRDFIDACEGYIEWVIPSTNVNGYPLNTEQMYYNFYLDGEIMTFTTDVYEEFEEDLTDVPYDYADGWDLQVLGEDHYITFKVGKYTNFGLQSFYIGNDGVTYASKLVEYTPEDSGLSSLIANSLVKAEFFDLQGRAISNPAAGGVYIMRSTFADGSVATTKVMKK